MRARRCSILPAATMAAAVATSGCATGPVFTSVQPPAPGAAAVYVFRGGGVLGAGVTHQLLVNGAPRGAMVNGAYRRIEVGTGTTAVSATGCQALTPPLSLPPGQIGYVQLELINKTVEFGGRYYFDYGCRFVQRSEAEALAVLQGLRQASH